MTTTTESNKPTPVMDGMTKEFYDFLPQRRTALPEMQRLRHVRHVPRLDVRRMRRMGMGMGALFRQRQAIHLDRCRAPHASGFRQRSTLCAAMIELAEGVRMISWVIDCPPADLVRGMPVQVVFQQVSDETDVAEIQARLTYPRKLSA